MKSEEINFKIENDLRKYLRIHKNIKFDVARRVLEDTPLWVSFITDGLNERILVASPLLEGLHLAAREKFFQAHADREFWMNFRQDDPIFCAKALDLNDDEDGDVFVQENGENFGGSNELLIAETIDGMVEALRLLNANKTTAAEQVLAGLLLHMAESVGAVSKLVDDKSLGHLFEIQIKLKERSAKVDSQKT